MMQRKTMHWDSYRHELLEILAGLEATGQDGAALEPDAACAALARRVRDCAAAKRRVYFVGNGASASMASHFSTDLAKMSGAPTEVFTDAALVTATGNDMGYAETFAFPLRQRMVPGEVLVAVSSSGNSPNVVKAVQAARELGGYSVTFTAMGQNNAMRALGDLNFYIPASTYGMAESGHAALLHFLIDHFTN